MSSVATNAVTHVSPNPEQSQALDRIAGELTAEQLIWSSGYLAGLAVAKTGPQDEVVLPSMTASPTQRLTILYGSQTGNGRALAEAFYQQVLASGLPVHLQDMADYTPKDIAKEHWLAVIVSTHGEGDAPDDAEMLLEFLQSKRAPQLDHLKFSVLALGDSSYAQYCQTGKDFDQQLEKLGGTRFNALIECDLDYQQQATEWAAVTLAHVEQELEEATEQKPAVALQVVPTAPKVDQHKPFESEVLLNQKITGDASSKRVHHLELDLSGSGLNYEPGDSLGVITQNPSALVAEFIEVLDASSDTPIDVDGNTVTLQESLKSHFEITATSGAFLQRYIALSQDADLEARFLDSQGKRELLNDYQVIDVLRTWRWNPLDNQNSVQAFVDTLRPLPPRVYSISSSPLANVDEVHLTVAEVAYEKFGRPHWGAASSALTNAIEAGETLPIYIEANHRFRLPQDTGADVIMIGPGTGVAPFRSFVEHRVATQAAGRNWLFFGDRNFDEDFLYQTEWQKHLKNGGLERLDVAFSRDQIDKVYVQNRLEEQGETIFEWLQGGAHLYVCGDANTMAPDVHATFLRIISEHGNLSADEAEQYLKNLKREQRYSRDVY